MSCHQTPDIIAGYFDNQLAGPQRQQLLQHLSGCEHCQRELAVLIPAIDTLKLWQNETVPAWDRAAVTVSQVRRLPAREHRHRFGGRHGWRQAVRHTARWIPLAASLVLAVAVMTQTRLDISEQGWHISFGSSAAEQQLAQLEDYLAQHASYQQQANQRMVETALQQFGDTTTDSLYQLVDWFEQQRALDMRRMEAGFQHMLDRDYQTVNSVQQLASFVQYQGELP